MKISNLQRVILLIAAAWLATSAILHLADGYDIAEAFDEALNMSRLPLVVFTLLFFASFGISNFNLPKVRKFRSKKAHILSPEWKLPDNIEALNTSDPEQASRLLSIISKEVTFLPSPRWKGKASTKDERKVLQRKGMRQWLRGRMVFGYVLICLAGFKKDANFLYSETHKKLTKSLGVSFANALLLGGTNLDQYSEAEIKSDMQSSLNASTEASLIVKNIIAEFAKGNKNALDDLFIYVSTDESFTIETLRRLLANPTQQILKRLSS